MDNEQKECPMYGMQTEADRMGNAWQVVKETLAREKPYDELAVPSTTPISKSPMGLPLTTTTQSSLPKGVSALSVTGEPANDTLLWTITIKTVRSEASSALAAILDSLVLWMTSPNLDEQ